MENYKNLKNLLETGYSSFMCDACSLVLSNNEELYEHDCFNGRTIYSNEGIIYCLNDDNVSNEETFDEYNSIEYNSIDREDYVDSDDCNDIAQDDIGQEPYVSQLKHTIPKPLKQPTANKNVAMWTDSSMLALLACYEAKMEDLDHPVKRGKVWGLIANELSQLGYKFSGEQVRWKFNTLTRKYKDCVDNSKKTGTGAMTFKFFDNMESILGDRKTIQGQNTISSTFGKKKSRSTTLSTFPAESDTSISSPSTSSIVSINSAKKQINEHSSRSESLNKNKQTLEKMASSNTEKTVCSTSVSNAQKTKRLQHGSGSRTAASKVELEKQWLQHLKNVADKNKIKEEKQEAYEKRKTEEIQIKKKLIALKERQLQVKECIAKRKYEEAAEWHRDKLNIEKQKCRLLRELLETHTLSSSKKCRTDSYED